MFESINVNCCKTLGCSNFGILHSPDYLMQGKNVLCRACGFLFPVISSTSLNLFRQGANRSWKGLIKQCPNCGGSSLKKYGFSCLGDRRIYCCDCHKTFIMSKRQKNDHRQALLSSLIYEGASLTAIRTSLGLDSTGLSRELSKLSRSANQRECLWAFSTLDITLSTRAFYVCFNGCSSRLYVLVTAEDQSGKVVAISTNYSAYPVEKAFQYTSHYEERFPAGTLTQLVKRKESLTMRRDTLFNIDYGSATLHKNDAGMLVKPVLPAYRHFELVRRLTDEHSLNVQHYIDHECFILGGCMMANLTYVQQGRSHIAFVRERGSQPPQRDIPPRLFMSGGIRNNIWRTFSTPDYAMAVCNLTGNKKSSAQRHATLKSATRFMQYLHRHPFYSQLGRLSPANVTATLEYLKYEYNKMLNTRSVE